MKYTVDKGSLIIKLLPFETFGKFQLYSIEVKSNDPMSTIMFFTSPILLIF